MDLTVTSYDLTQYTSPSKAKEALLDAYFGDAGYDRVVAARNAGLALSTVEEWFLDPRFQLKVEKRLQSMVQRKSSLQEDLLAQSGYIMQGNITDLFEQTDTGALVVKNIKTLPRHITACIKQMDVVRTSVPGRPAEFTEALRVVMHDKTKVMNIIGDYTDVKNTALKRADSGAPKMVGLSVITAEPTKEIGYEDSYGGEVHDDQEAEADTNGDGIG